MSPRLTESELLLASNCKKKNRTAIYEYGADAKSSTRFSDSSTN